ncbi:MAG: hypothetical protein UZ12_BCD005001184 [Bacteroidetes bacterium OLB12]|nr:MAG: hypothetical protein UZ12_BCD005001184 [Bacteroidetes bacterium OLB12]
MRYGIVLLMCLLVGVAQAQWKSELPAMEIKKGQGGTICYHKPEDANLIIPPPAAYEAWKRNPATRTSATTFEVEYVNFSEEAKQAFQKAVDIWSGLIESPVPIRILAVWQPLSGSVLGGAAPGTYIRDFDGPQKYAPGIRLHWPKKLPDENLTRPIPRIFLLSLTARLVIGLSEQMVFLYPKKQTWFR